MTVLHLEKVCIVSMATIRAWRKLVFGLQFPESHGPHDHWEVLGFIFQTSIFSQTQGYIMNITHADMHAHRQKPWCSMQNDLDPVCLCSTWLCQWDFISHTRLYFLYCISRLYGGHFCDTQQTFCNSILASQCPNAGSVFGERRLE